MIWSYKWLRWTYNFRLQCRMISAMRCTSVSGTMLRTSSTERQWAGPQQDTTTMTSMRQISRHRCVGSWNFDSCTFNTFTCNLILLHFFFPEPQAFGFEERHRGRSVPDELSSVSHSIGGVVEGAGQTSSGLRLRRLPEDLREVWNALPVWRKPRRFLQSHPEHRPGNQRTHR